VRFLVGFGCRRRVDCGPGVARPKSRHPGCESAAPAMESFPDSSPELPAPSDASRVGLHMLVQGVADLAFEPAALHWRSCSRSAFCVVGAAFASGVGDRGHVDT